MMNSLMMMEVENQTVSNDWEGGYIFYVIKITFIASSASLVLDGDDILPHIGNIMINPIKKEDDDS